MHFNSSTVRATFAEERFEVGLPWKKDHPPLVDNYKQAYQRLEFTERKLTKEPMKVKLYCEAVKQYIDDGHARLLEEDD